jgi:glycosyltransferase involved in cell wall biosynthesis
VTVTLCGDFVVYDGYGSMNEFMARGMHRAGAAVNIMPILLDVRGYSEEFLRLVACSTPHVDGPVLFSTWPRPELDCFGGADVFIRAMYEATTIPDHWPAMLNRTRAVIAPTTYVADVFRANGVTVPIAVVPDGVDPDVYHYEPRPRRPGLTTLFVGLLSDRKHYREAIAAWRLAFAGDPEARLIIKSRWGQDDGLNLDDPRIELRTENEWHQGIAHWYRQADVLLALGNEGFGLPLIEGMATGLPVIALASEGQKDVCREAGDLVLAVEPASWEGHRHYGGDVSGVHGVPGVEDVAARLRWVAEHRDEAADIGRAASAWVHRHRSVWSYGPSVLAVMEEHMGRSLRRRVRRDRPGGGERSPRAGLRNTLAALARIR